MNVCIEFLENGTYRGLGKGSAKALMVASSLLLCEMKMLATREFLCWYGW